MSTQWNNLREFSTTWIQPGGPGNAWKILDIDGAMVDAIEGGGTDYNLQFGLDNNGRNVYKGQLQGGDPDPLTTTLSRRLNWDRLLLIMKALRCPFTLQVNQRCGGYNLLDYYASIGGFDGHTTSNGMDSPLAQLADGEQSDIMFTNDVQFSPYYLLRKKLVINDASNQAADFKFNRVISVGYPKCPGNCSPTVDDGDNSFWAVTNTDSTPGYFGARSKFYWTNSDGVFSNTNSAYIDVFSSNVVDVQQMGDYIVVTSATEGVAYALYSDVVNGVINAWTVASGSTSSGVGPNRLFAINGATAYGVGNSGKIWRTTDGGRSWTLLSNGTVTSVNLNSVFFVSETLGWIAGNSGALIKYQNGVFSLVTVRGTALSGSTTTVTANINVVSSPYGRDQEVYVGTAGGQIWRSNDRGLSWAEKSIDKAGVGTIVDLQFIGYNGETAFFIQNNTDNESRVCRDISGGDFGVAVEILGSGNGFDNPANNGFTSIATPQPNKAVVVGNTVNSYAFIGNIAA